MICTKKQFESDIENISKKYEKTNAKPLLKDLSDCITFSCIYGGQENAILSDVLIYKKTTLEYEVVESLKDIEKSKVFAAKRYSLSSYDKTLEMIVVFSSQYLSFEKLNDTGSYIYKCEYFIDSQGNFVRQCFLKQELLNKKQDIYELCEGSLEHGVYLSNTYEKNSGMKVECFKLPNIDKKDENVYFKYFVWPDSLYMCKTSPKFKDVPYLEVLGMNSLSNMLVEQFEGGEEPTKIEDGQFFDHLKSASKTYYFKKPATSKKK